MPSRSVIAAVLLFWLGMAAWYVAREIAPRWGRDDVPPFHIDLTDEVGAPMVEWHVLWGDKKVARATTQVRRLDDDLFELKAEFAASKVQLAGVEVNAINIQTRYRVGVDGQLRHIALSGHLTQAGLDLKGGVSGKVEKGVWAPALEVGDQPIPDLPFLPTVRLGSAGSVMNTMMPHNRIPHLRVGQKWRVPLLDPVGDLKGLLGKGAAIEELEALVVVDTLNWNGDDVECFKIEYREPGKAETTALTFVRRSDGIVLKQEAEHAGVKLVLVRAAPRP